MKSVRTPFNMHFISSGLHSSLTGLSPVVFLMMLCSIELKATIFNTLILAPVITCPPNITIDCSESTSPTNTGSAMATDTCGNTPIITFNDVSFGGTCPQEMIITRTWIATDTCGNSTTCDQIISVIDTIAPIITCPPNVTIDCSSSPLPGAYSGSGFLEDFDGIAGSTSGGPGTYSFPAGWLRMNVDNNTPSGDPRVSWIDEAWERREDFPFNDIDSAAFSTSYYNPAGSADDWMWTPSIFIGTNGVLTWNAKSYLDNFPEAYSVRVMVSPNEPTGSTGNLGNMVLKSFQIFGDNAENPTWTPHTESLALFAGKTIRIAFRNFSEDQFSMLVDDVEVTSAAGVGLPPATATDACDPAPILTYTDITVSGACDADFAINRTWIATDACGNSSTCLQVVAVQDITPPTITCEIQTSPIDCPNAPVFIPPTVFDECDPAVEVTFSDVTTPGFCAGSYSVTRTWTAIDACGNAATCSSTIEVLDNTSPTIICTIQNSPVNCPGIPEFLPPIATDACDASVSVTFSDETTPNPECVTSPNTYFLIRTWTATDDCGNTASCSRTIQVIDIIPPTIVCAAQITPIDCPNIPVFTPPTVTDLCDQSVTVTFSDLTTPGSCAGTYSVTRTWTATDDCGFNSATCSATIIVQDITPPTISCVAQTTPINCPAVPVFTPPTATDACDASVTVGFTDVTTQGTCAGTYSVTRTWTATDDCGNTASCSGTIVVRDISPPTITCANQTTPINCPATPIWIAPTATDACDATVALTFSDATTQGACAGTYSVTRTWTASDDCGNTATCSRTIVVRDITPPAMTCPTQTTPINCPATPVWVMPVATDACDASVTITFQDFTTPGSCAGSYSITRIWTATDDCGNFSICINTIVVQDITPPTIVCVNQTTPVNCPLTPVFTPPTATDACDQSVTITFSDLTTPVSCPGIYSVTRTWTATDDCGNSASCNRTIVVRDIAPPSITCLAQITPINCPAVPVFTPPAVVDACDASVTVTFIDVTTQGSCTGTYSVTRTWTATDDCANSSSCSSSIEVIDNTPPTIICSTQTSPVQCPSLPVFTPPIATDACDATVTITFADATTQGSCAGTYSVTRTWTATDDCGNTASCSRTIEVRDVTPPAITCAAQNTPINCPEVPVFIAPTATDACDASVTISYSDATVQGSCAGTYSVTRTWTAIDDCANSVTCSRTIVVQDITPPTIICAVQITPINCPEVPVFTAPTATDACSATVIITFSDVTNQGSCAGITNVTRTWTATDDCGNTATCSGTIVTRDITAPIMTCVAQTTPINCPSVPVFNTPVASDECDATVTVTFTDATTQGSCAGTYSVTRTWTGTDDCGNNATCSATIVVRDITPPTIVCAVQATPIQCPAVPVFTDPIATDACDASVTITFSDATIQGSCPGTYSVTRTWTATDDCGNNATCSRTIVVQDITPPVIVCANQTTPINCPAVPVFTAPMATDACDASVTITFTDATSQGSCPGTYSVTRTWSATDDCGNSATCSRTIVVQDITPPTIVCANQTTPINCPAVPVFSAPAVSDACDASVTLTFTDLTTAGSCVGTYSVTRTWRATDDCGNSAVCSRTIVVQDMTPPVCMTQDITVTINQNIGTHIISAEDIDNGSSDACSAVSLSVTPNSFTCSSAGPNVVVLTVTDLCGNSSTCTAMVMVNTCFDSCITIHSWAYLEGAATNANGYPMFALPMRTTLNNLHVLPGQAIVDPFYGNKYSPPGQPYNIAPWNYMGDEGDAYDSGGDPMMGSAGYPSTVVDWVLVSLRGDAAGTGGPLCQAAALLHKNGSIQFVQEFDCCDLDLYGSYYLVVEHRNHLIIMSPTAIPIVPGIDSSTITYDFRGQQSYVDDPFMIGIFAGQKELLPQFSGVYGMFAGNGNQTNTAFSDTDINFDDRSYWEGENGQIGEYSNGDYNMNTDTNFNDRVTWERNNGKFTSVPRN